uniref:HDAg domain-containing protein n=1 Tax=Strigamia maritima TaxID=126957 RepID=T1IIP8_STRMM
MKILRHLVEARNEPFNMALVRDSDTSLWLHNKLGTSNDLWSGGSICSQLNQDVLRNVKECFIDLQVQVKLKLLLAFLHIPRRNVEEWRVELEEILEIALADGDQWVSMLAEILKTYPATGTLNLEVEENSKIFTDLVADLKKIVRKSSDLAMLPMECLYLNKNSLNALIGHQAQPVKHFTLKRKPKSAALRAELLQKSNDALNSSKRNVPISVPIRSRGLIKKWMIRVIYLFKLPNAFFLLKKNYFIAPLKGLPSRSPMAGFRSPPTGLSRLGSTPSSLIRPPTRTPAGKKDGGIKLLDINEQPMGYGREAKRRKKQAEMEVVEQQKKEKETSQTGTPAAMATPDYAIGLVSTGLSTQLSTTSTSSVLQQTRENLQQTLQQTQVRTQMVTTPINIPTVTATAIVVTQQPVQTQQSQPQQQQQQTVQASATPQPAQPVQVQQVQIQPSQTIAVAQLQPQQTPKKGLSLTKEQIQEAQEMFRTSNKVTRPEKALILGFMAGSRENPCPHLGNVVTIKLNEDKEIMQPSDGNSVTMLVETHFQMNYNNGEWKRIKKYRKVEEAS